MIPTSAPAEAHPLRIAVLVAALGSTGISIVSIPPALLLAFVSISFASDGSGSDLPMALGMTVLGTAIIAAGFYLLFGYWRAWRGRLEVPRRIRFWMLSAAYNGIGLLVILGSVASTTLYSAEQWAIAAVALGWLGFMTGLSVQCARIANEGDLAI